MKRSETQNYWQQQLDAMVLSGLTQLAWCRENQIPYNTLSYWRKKLPVICKQKHPGPDQFIAIDLSHSATVHPLQPIAIETPRGYRLLCSDASQLALLAQLIQVVN